MNKLLFLICFSAFLPLIVQAQNQNGDLATDLPAHDEGNNRKEVHILHADKLSRELYGDQPVRRLLGNVRLRQDSTWLSATEAIQYLESDEIIFIGAVRIIEQGDTIWADRIKYYTKSKLGNAIGNVRLSDGEANVFAPRGTYNADLKHATFAEGVRLVDSVSVLTSQSGEYWSDTKKARFYDHVLLEQEDLRLLADSVEYLREAEQADAHGNVSILQYKQVDSTAITSVEADSTTLNDQPPTNEETYLFGNHVFQDRLLGISRVNGDPLLMRLTTDSLGVTDTLLVEAERINVFETDSLTQITAIDSVKMIQANYATIADSVVVDQFADSTRSDEIRFYQNPVGWFDDTQMSGDTIRVIAPAGHLDVLEVTNNAFVAIQDTSSLRLNQLKGINLKAFFVQDSLSSMMIKPNAEALYFRQNEADEPDGGIQMSSDSMLFLFEQGELEQMKGLSQIEGTYYTEENMPSGLSLAGLNWIPNKKPDAYLIKEEHNVEARIQALKPTENANPLLNNHNEKGINE